MLNLDLDPTLVKHLQCTLTHHTRHLCRVICKSHQGFKRYRADTIVCLTLNYDVDLEVTLVKHALCTSSHGTLHLCQVTNLSRVIEERTGNTVIQCLTLNYDLDLGQTYTEHIDSSYFCAEVFEIFSPGDQKRSQKGDEWTDRLTDGQTDNEA